MNEWSFQLFNEKLGNKIEIGLVSGKPFSGKTKATEILSQNHGFKVIDMNKIEEEVKASLAGEEGEPFEGEVAIADIEKSICGTIENAKSEGGRSKFVFDGYKHETEDAFIKFVS